MRRLDTAPAVRCRRVNTPIPPPSTGPVPAGHAMSPDFGRASAPPTVAPIPRLADCAERVPPPRRTAPAEQPPPNGPRRKGRVEGPHRTGRIEPAASNRSHRTGRIQTAASIGRAASRGSLAGLITPDGKTGLPVQYDCRSRVAGIAPAAQSCRPRCARPSYEPRCAYSVVPAARWADRVVRAALGQSRCAGRLLRANAVEQAIGPSRGRPWTRGARAAHAVLVG